MALIDDYKAEMKGVDEATIVMLTKSLNNLYVAATQNKGGKS